MPSAEDKIRLATDTIFAPEAPLAEQA